MDVNNVAPVIQLQKPTPLQPSANHMSKYSQCPHCGQVKSIDEFPFHVKQCKEKHTTSVTSPYASTQFYAASSPPPPIAVPMPTTSYFVPPSKYTQTAKPGMGISSVPPKIGQSPILPNHHIRPVIPSPQTVSPAPSPIRPMAHTASFQQSTTSSPIVSHPMVSHSPIVTPERRESYYTNTSSSKPSPSPIVTPPKASSNSTSAPTAKKPRTRANTVEEKEPAVEYTPLPNVDFKYKPKQTWTPMPKIPDGPVFKPTEEEFKDPMKYLASIAPVVRKYGIAKIIPPSNTWLQGKPFTKVVNPKTFIFQTKSQSIHQLQHRQGPNEKFLEELEQFLKERGAPIRTIPTIDGRELDVYKLYCSVMARGGLQQVIRLKKWPEIIRELHISSDCTSAATLLKRNYYRFLWSYELSQNAKNANISDAEMKTIEKEAAKWANDDSISDKKPETDEFGYGDGRIFTLSSFKKFANTFKKKWFDMDEEIPPEEIENAYWRILENCEDSVEVHYGSDLEVSSHGSGFPNTPDDLRNASGWNLNIFAKLPGSLLSFLHENIGGVTIPMMYMGMLFSSFCWHTEDNYLYSINYLHHGAAKSWYGIPGYAADDFERVMKKTVPELFEAQPDLLHLLVTMLSPRILMENNVPIYHFIQEAGEFVITLPRAYHAGFSHGFNCAESSNFALYDWFPFGRSCLQKYRHFARSSVVSIEKILCNAALSNPISPELREILKSELVLVRKTEQHLREKVFEREGTWKAIHFDAYEGREVEVKECEICKFDCSLSAIACPCSPDKIVCLQHSNELCDCDPAKKTLLFRWKLSDIDNLLKNVGVDPATLIEDVKMNDVVDKENIQNQSSPERSALGRGHAGKKSRHETLLHTLVGTSKPSIRKLARLEGVRKLKKAGLDYNDLACAADSYIIEKLVEKKTNEGKTEYLIKWQNYPESENTWVTADELGCPGLIEAFENGNRPITLKAHPATKVTKSRKMARSISHRRM